MFTFLTRSHSFMLLILFPLFNPYSIFKKKSLSSHAITLEISSIDIGQLWFLHLIFVSHVKCMDPISCTNYCCHISQQLLYLCTHFIAGLHFLHLRVSKPAALLVSGRASGSDQICRYLKCFENAPV